jgi:predicted acetyltransferase
MNVHVYLKEPTQEDEHDVWRFREEFTAPAYITNIPGAAGLEAASTYSDWLKEIGKYAHAETVPAGRVLATTLLARRVEDKALVGIVNIRHSLSEHLLKVGGNIGYSVDARYRQQGYATEILKLALDFCRTIDLSRVLVTCDSQNIASAKVIQANGGVLENELEENGVVKQRYWIVL